MPSTATDAPSPGTYECQQCGELIAVDHYIVACPACGGPVQLRSAPQPS